MYLSRAKAFTVASLILCALVNSNTLTWWFSRATDSSAPAQEASSNRTDQKENEQIKQTDSQTSPVPVEQTNNTSVKKDTPAPCENLINPYALGFTSLEKEFELKDMRVLGEIPSWLNGSFMVVGPGKFEIDKSKAGHWFDGFAMLHRFSFNAGRASYANKFINSEYLQESRANGKMSTAASASDPNASFFSKMASALSDEAKPRYDNTNINIACFGSCCVALTESPLALIYDPHTLKTKGELTYNDTFDPHMSCAHPIFDAHTNEYYGLATTFGNTSSYSVYKLNTKKMERIVLTTINSSLPSYMHSFSVTKRFIILTEIPFVVSPYDLIMSGKPFIENFQWKGKQKTRVHVIDRATGTLLGTVNTLPFFAFHHINAWDENDTIALDCAAYDDASIVHAFFLNPILNSKEHTFPHAKLMQINITFENGNKRKPLADTKIMSSTPIEMPRINNTVHMQPYKYVYGVNNSQKNTFFNQLVKIERATGTATFWKADHCHPTEPVFVAKPNAKNEDDGILLSVVLNTQHCYSFLLIVDAATMREIARVDLAHHIPYSVHGNYYPR